MTRSSCHFGQLSFYRTQMYRFQREVRRGGGRGGVQEAEISWQAILGYVNFSEGRPEPRFQKQLNEAFRLLGQSGAVDVVAALAKGLRRHIADLNASGASAFQDIHQAQAALSLVFDK